MNPLYIPPDHYHAEYSEFRTTVDGIPSLSYGVFVRELFEFMGVHDLHQEGMCPMCDGQLTPYTHLMYDGMRWAPHTPIVRFTSEGLQVSCPSTTTSERSTTGAEETTA